MLKQLSSLFNNSIITHKLHDKVKLLRSLKSVDKVHKERVVNVLQNYFLCLCMLKLVFLNNIVLRDRFHCKKVLSSLFFDQQNSAESSFAQNYFRNKVIDSDFLLKILCEQSLRRFSDNFFFLFLLFDILFVRLVIVENVLPLNILGAELFLILFCHGIKN